MRSVILCTLARLNGTRRCTLAPMTNRLRYLIVWGLIVGVADGLATALLGWVSHTADLNELTLPVLAVAGIVALGLGSWVPTSRRRTR